MPSFLSDLSKFQGTGEKNADGKTLEEFLEEYDPYRYQTPLQYRRHSLKETQ